MTYRGFLAQFYTSLRKRRVFLFDGGTEATRVDLLHMLEKRFNSQRVDLGIQKVKRRVCRLSEVADSLSSLSAESVYTLVVVHWEKGLVEPREVKAFLRSLKACSSWFVILDDTGEVKKVFEEVYGTTTTGVNVSCNRLPMVMGDKETLIKKRLNLVGITAEEDVVRYLAERGSFSEVSLFNTFRILESLSGGRLWVGLDMKTMRKCGLLMPDIEKALMRVLFDRGRIYFLSLPEVIFNERRFLWYVIRELILLLKCKTARGVTDQKRSGIVGLPYPVYIDYKIRSEKVELKLLYKRLYSALSLARYRNFRGVTTMLVSVW